jgi:hypothetical protein
MRLGIDFDNTIVCYDALFHRVAREQGVIPAHLPANKSEVRNHLRTVGREDVWTALQGLVYGARMGEADPYPGVLDFLHACRRTAIPVFVVSHKTRHPFLGEPYDLHAAALAWLQNHGFFDPDRLGLPRDHVFFELTKQAKLQRIAACRCTHFIDDLPEFLAEPAFPPRVDRLLFDPNRLYPGETRFRLLHAWPDAATTLPLPAPQGRSQGSAPDPIAAGPRPSRPLCAPPASHASDPPPRSDPARAADSPPHPSPRSTPKAGETPARRHLGDAPPTPSAASDSSDPTPFLAAHGVPPDAPLTPLPGGANNRVYRLRTPARDLVLKRYFHAPADPRDRFGAERAFYSWAWNRGLRRTPEPIAWDPDRRLGLFEWIEGRKLAPAEPGPHHLAQAIAFVAELNADRHLPAAAELPVASEACFALREHLDRIEGRVDRLRRLEPATDLDRDAAAFDRPNTWPPAGRSVRERAASAGSRP